jgi:hypothetical protein
MKTLLLTLVFLLVSCLVYSQQAIKVSARTKQSKPSYTNIQGFRLPGNIPDTCRVYEGSKGAKFVFRQSKKTGLIYKSYLPKK